MTETMTPQKPKVPKFLLWILGILVGIVVLVIIIAAVSGPVDGDEAGAADTTTSTSVEDAEDQESGQPANPEDELREAITDAVDDATVHFGDEEVIVTFPMGAGWSESTMATSAQNETVDIISAVKESAWFNGTQYLSINISAELVDQMGNEKVREVVTAGYTAGTLEQINPDGIRAENVWGVADHSFVHPLFR